VWTVPEGSRDILNVVVTLKKLPFTLDCHYKNANPSQFAEVVML